MFASCLQPFNHCSRGCIVGSNAFPDRRPVQFLDTSFQSLTDSEKERVHRDLYGTEEPVVESPKFIDDKLEELEKELQILSNKTKKAYLEALQQDHNQGEEYVFSRSFRLMFLRADQFNARLAARRLARHFKEKVQLFGSEKLAKRIQQADLNEDDMEVLRSGLMFATGATDAYERAIVIVSHSCFYCFKLVHIKRVIFYELQSLLEDHEESQKKGLVFIGWNLDPVQTLSLSKHREVFFPTARLNRGLPMKVACMHQCYSENRFLIVLNILLVVFPKDVRARIQCHNGSVEECLNDLASYGIDAKALLISESGDIRKDIILSSLAERRKREEGAVANDSIKSETQLVLPSVVE